MCYFFHDLNTNDACMAYISKTASFKRRQLGGDKKNIKYEF